MNQCEFSPDRVYRYVLSHGWEDLFNGQTNSIAWIGLNPSTADEAALDPTLRRIKSFTTSLGGNRFFMLNLFGYRATDPRQMKMAKDPVGPLNDEWIWRVCRDAETVIACWGTHGKHLDQDKQILELLKDIPIYRLSLNEDGSPGHPLYLPKGSGLQRFA